jgi:hypothetical protein
MVYIKLASTQNNLNRKNSWGLSMCDRLGYVIGLLSVGFFLCFGCTPRTPTDIRCDISPSGFYDFFTEESTYPTSGGYLYSGIFCMNPSIVRDVIYELKMEDDAGTITYMTVEWLPLLYGHNGNLVYDRSTIPFYDKSIQVRAIAPEQRTSDWSEPIRCTSDYYPFTQPNDCDTLWDNSK